MRNFKKPLIAAALTALFYTTAFADVANIDKLPDGKQVTLSGIVESVQNERTFTLRDDSGDIKVDIKSHQSVILKEGDSVTVIGKVDKHVIKSDVNATVVTVHKHVTETVRAAIQANGDISLQGATSFSINKLPDNGLVKIMGTVSDVDNEKEFTLRDATGSINVDIAAAEESAALTKGAQVTVVGYIDNGVLGKDINATQVFITADAQPMAAK